MSLCISISIVVYEMNPTNFGRTLDCLDTAIDVIKGEMEVTTTVQIIDNGNNRTLLAKVINRRPLHYELMDNESNTGYSAHNLSIANTDSDFHLVLNPDVYVKKDSILVAIKYLREESDVVLLGPKAVDVMGNNAYLNKRYPALLDLVIRGLNIGALNKLFAKRLARYAYHELAQETQPIQVQLFSGCFMLIRTQPLKLVNGFDEDFFLYFEDFDLSIRLKSLGRTVYHPQVQIIHSGGFTGTKGYQHWKFFLRSANTFYRKHGLRLV